MKREFGSNKRKAISPVLATVVLIAITLISAISIAGFVFGLFGSFSNSAQILGIQTSMSAGDATKATGLTSATCSATGGADYVAFRNTGTQSATINSFALTYEGQTFSALPSGAGACTLVAGGATVFVNLVFTGATGKLVSSGTQYVGTISASNGGASAYSGHFQ